MAATKEAPMSGEVPGPVAGQRMTEDYIRSLGRLAYLWGWPLVNMHNRLSIMETVPGRGCWAGWSRRPRRAVSGCFGTDYLSRTAMGKANILVNTPAETTYFYQDLDTHGERLDGSRSYSVTFPPGQLPPDAPFNLPTPKRRLAGDTRTPGVGREFGLAAQAR
jgi:hypothetical protein